MISDKHLEKILEIEGHKVPIWIYGNPKNLPILFIHGYFRGFSDYVGDLPPRYLMKNFCVIAFDLPGFGRNKSLKYNSLEFIKKIVDLTVPKRKIAIFGVSYGGALAVRYTVLNPIKIRALIIAGTPLYTGFYKLIFLLLYIPRIRSKLNFLSDFLYLKRENLEKINAPVLLYYSKKDRFATTGMGERLSAMLKDVRLFKIYSRTHGYLLHRIDETGFLTELEKLLA